VGPDADDDSVLGEAELGAFHVSGADGLGGPFEVVAAVGRAEELLV